VDFCGTGALAKTQTVIGGLNTITGTSSHVAFKDMNIASGSANVLCTFSGSGGSHVFENVGSNINLSPVLVQFGTGCFSTTVPNLISDFGKSVARFYQCDFSTAAGKIVLPNLPAGNYACIQIADCVIAGGISIGDGWNVLYNVDSRIGPITYTGTATKDQYILTTLIKGEFVDGETLVNSNDIIVLDNFLVTYDTAGLKPGTKKLIISEFDGKLRLKNTKVLNGWSADSPLEVSPGVFDTFVTLVNGESCYLIYQSPTESYLVRTREVPHILYDSKYYISKEAGSPTLSGKSINCLLYTCDAADDLRDV
jgi:hypothetical protein